MSTGFQNVHVRVNDATTCKPTACRIRFTDSEGRYYAPFGRLTEFATGRGIDVGGNVRLGHKAYAYIDGGCEIRLPVGPLHVEISKGPEYLPLSEDVTLIQGKLAMRFELKRMTNLRAQGWYSGDTRSHFLSPPAALLEAAAEDVAVANVLVRDGKVQDSDKQERPALSHLLEFSGQVPALQTAEHLVAINTQNLHPILGSLGLLNCHRVVYPLSFGGPTGADDWALADWCNQCHRKAGLVVWTNNPPLGLPDITFGEPLADLILGRVDAFEIDFYEDSPFDVLPNWYTLLEAGLRVPLVGASGKDSNGIALGCMRTYARLQEGEALSYKAWIEAVRAGRTYATNGPLIQLLVAGPNDGRPAVSSEGRTLRTESTATLKVVADVFSSVEFESLELLVNGEVLAESSSVCKDSKWLAELQPEITLPEGGWIAARCRGSKTLPHRPAVQRVFAHTSPVYVRVKDKPPRANPVAVRRLVRDLERMLEWVRKEARCDEKQRAHLEEVFEGARQKLLSEPEA